MLELRIILHSRMNNLESMQILILVSTIVQHALLPDALPDENTSAAIRPFVAAFPEGVILVQQL